ncbi:conserved hypothetical protein [Ferrimonas balearica DSM 9799]|uniref:Cytochrome c domain-containing protein n=1 Tax=Ferrimonas balearica (strain DSM 9799 / CCM 4581 / KCTC 23876 / PAT) TaxID=550540 RepID=E1SV97_FERBD|nr:SO2930 family diheme c-type cytochrome [Ferrimonas balearica]ADN74251.1 conserved hypothetical protein [Ferrimonas balearica DSM 9799]
MKYLYLPLLLGLLSCGGGGESASEPPPPEPPAPPPTNPDPADPATPCDAATSEVNWDALMSENCELLSQYGLFVDPAVPTRDARVPGLRYQLTTALFSDYASKYRFLFLPPGTQMTYHDSETFGLPVGTVLVKTFALPADTALSGDDNETVIETRLLIHRESGWVALPYLWQGNDAEFTPAGTLVAHQMIHQDETLAFNYEVPSQPQCKMCHQLSDGTTARFSPIGIKARLLNRPGDNGSNQLQHWLSQGWLDRVPESIPTAADLYDTTASLTERAKGYLDVNCAHCHRAEGFASISGLRLGYFVDHTTMEYGICKQPPGYDGGAAGLDYDIVPGNGLASILPYRMAHLEPKDKMPPVGRAVVHDYAVDLIRNWIDTLDPALGSCQ